MSVVAAQPRSASRKGFRLHSPSSIAFAELSIASVATNRPSSMDWASASIATEVVDRHHLQGGEDLLERLNGARPEVLP